MLTVQRRDFLLVWKKGTCGAEENWYLWADVGIGPYGDGSFDFAQDDRGRDGSFGSLRSLRMTGGGKVCGGVITPPYRGEGVLRGDEGIGPYG